MLEPYAACVALCRYLHRQIKFPDAQIIFTLLHAHTSYTLIYICAHHHIILTYTRFIWLFVRIHTHFLSFPRKTWSPHLLNLLATPVTLCKGRQSGSNIHTHTPHTHHAWMHGCIAGHNVDTVTTGKGAHRTTYDSLFGRSERLHIHQFQVLAHFHRSQVLTQSHMPL